MMPLLQWVEQIDSQKMNFIDQTRKNYSSFRAEVQSIDDLNEEETEYYLRTVKNYRRNYLAKNWCKIIDSNLKYKQPGILNLQPQDLNTPEKLYVLPIFIDSGKHNLMFCHHDVEMDMSEWHFERSIVDFRAE